MHLCCEGAGRACIRKARGGCLFSVTPLLLYGPVVLCRRLNVQSSGAAGFMPASRRVLSAQRPPPSVLAWGVRVLTAEGDSVTLSQIESAVSVVIWRTELPRATTLH